MFRKDMTLYNQMNVPNHIIANYVSKLKQTIAIWYDRIVRAL